ncbi:Zinc finger protein 701 [Plecturocebus cupreus]
MQKPKKRMSDIPGPSWSLWKGACGSHEGALLSSPFKEDPAPGVHLAISLQPHQDLLQQMGFLHVGQAGLELLTLGDPPTSASQSAGITDLKNAEPTPNRDLDIHLDCVGAAFEKRRTLGGQGRQITRAQEFETSLANMAKPRLY